MLHGLRVLDLTDERGLLCGRLLADMGADVVQVERSSAANESFAWRAFTAGKRRLVCDPAQSVDRGAIEDLALRADVLVTSWHRDELREAGWDPDSLRERAPHLVYTHISAFGWDGPKAEYADADLIVWAAGGPLAPHRDGARPPVRISSEQAFLHAGADAAVGTLLALVERERSGLGQTVDVSAQVSVGQATLARILADAAGDADPEWQRSVGSDRSGSGAATPARFKKWRCRDGLIELHLSMGHAAGAFTNRLLAWIGESIDVAPAIAETDWREVPDQAARGEWDPALLDDTREIVAKFLATKTKDEVLAGALSRRLLCMPIFDIADVVSSIHLRARGFFSELDGVTLPGRFARIEGAPEPQVRASPGGGAAEEIGSIWSGPRSWASSAREEPRSAPLEGLRVLDLSWVVAGPLIGRTLADFGADVIRVESSNRVDTARMMQPFVGGKADREGSVLYGNSNAGKRGITLDLASEAGRDIVRRLAADADVMVESFAPGQLARWGLDPEDLRAANPRLITLSTSIAGQTGPWSTLAGFGNVGSSLSGLQGLVGWPEDLPFGPFGPYTDYVGPRFGLAALLASVLRQRRIGAGCSIDVAQLEAGAFFLSPEILRWSVDGVVARRRGNRDAVHAPHGVYRAGDADARFVAIAVTDDAEWAALARAIGRDDLADRPDLRTAEGRRGAADELDAAIGEWAREHEAAAIEEILQRERVPAHLAVTPADYVADAQIRFRGHLVTLPHPLHGAITVEGPRVALSATPGAVRSAAPTLGQHSAEVLSERLAWSAADIARAEQEGILT